MGPILETDEEESYKDRMLSEANTDISGGKSSLKFLAHTFLLRIVVRHV
jgi:hypothetical protein